LSYTQRLRKVRERYEEALRAQHPEATKMRALMGFASEKAGAEPPDFAGASKALDKLDELLKSGPAEGSAAKAGNGPATATGGADPGDAIKARLTEMIASFKAAVAAGHPEAQELKLRISEAGVLARKREFDAANAMLDDVERALKGGPAPGAPGGDDDEPAAPSFESLTADLPAARRGLVEARDALDEALTKADAQVRKLQALMAVHPDRELREIAGSPDFGINALTGGWRVKLLASLRELQDARPDALPKVLPRASRTAGSFLKHVRKSERIRACDENPLGVPVQTRDLLVPALTRLNAAVGAFAG
jgi:hypothetical protein